MLVQFSGNSAGPMAVLLEVGGLVLGLAMIGVVVIVLFLISGRTAAERPQVDKRFWTFYRVNDRLYRDPNKRRLSWSQERFRHHRFRWQSEM